mmetsp:Transcript_38323/g.122979  ORF Transcript_38323/g.122979 Transcript_38323/m.122979 type:complete len:280 (+) Transcript_38323:62-901(+)
MPPSKVPTSFLCPITHEVMRDPVSTSDGQSYERRAIEHWLQHSNLSPLTGEQLHSKALTRNHALRNAIGEYDRAQPGLCLAEARGPKKVILLGDSGVGKTSLLHRAQNATFSEGATATIGCAFCPHTVELPSGRVVELHIWDTAGQEKYRAFARQYFRGSDAAVVLFDLSNRASLDGAQRWIDELRAELPEQPGLSLTLAGSKRDLCPKARQVKTQDAKAVAAANGASYLEVSARDGMNVAELFAAVAASVDPESRPASRGVKLDDSSRDGRRDWPGCC